MLNLNLPKSVIVDYNDLEIEEKIGAGGFGQVYRGRWHGTTVAIKRVYDVVDESMIAEFQKEVRAARLCRRVCVLGVGNAVRRCG